MESPKTVSLGEIRQKINTDGPFMDLLLKETPLLAGPLIVVRDKIVNALDRFFPENGNGAKITKRQADDIAVDCLKAMGVVSDDDRFPSDLTPQLEQTVACVSRHIERAIIKSF